MPARRCTRHSRRATCAPAILLYKIPRVVIGENRTFVGAEDLLRGRGVEVVNLDSDDCVRMMDEFIATHPELWWEDIGVEGPTA